MQKIFLRRLRSDDARCATQVQVETWHETYPGLLPQKMLDAMTVERMMPLYQKALQDPNIYVLGAFGGDELLGMGTAANPRHEFGFDGEIWSMNVPQRYQGQGIGRQILSELFSYCHERGWRRIYLMCLDQNKAALGFYQKMGGRLGDTIEKDGFSEIIVSWQI